VTVVPLREADEEAAFGGKAVQLGKAMRGNLPVPPGVALSVDLVNAIAAGEGFAREMVESLVSTLGTSLAVRSSAVGEDGTLASFAGIHSTRINVTSTPELVEAVAEVAESGRSERAIAYRKSHHIVSPPRVGIVVQRMVDADRAGVMFTRHPVSGRDEILIEAAWGLGETVVSGLVNPDVYRMGRSGVILEQRPGLKDRAIVLRHDGGSREIAVESARRGVLCLESTCLRRLHELSVQCESVFGVDPHDIEWAFAGTELYLLQLRPITVGGAR
jgi:pyruvate,water dikinase